MLPVDRKKCHKFCKKDAKFPPFFTSTEAGVIAFCEGKKRKKNLVLKERKLSAVKLVSTGENQSSDAENISL